MQLVHSHTGVIAPHHVRDDLFAGGLTGQIAGLIMAIVMMAVYAFVLQAGALYPIQVIGSFVTGNIAVAGHFDLASFLAGVVLHMFGPSLVWGLVFAAIVHALDVRKVGTLLLVGLGIGLASQVIDVELLVPPFFRALHGHDIWHENVPEFWSWAAHAVYGLSLAIFAWVRPRIVNTVDTTTGARAI
jgi:hypothetical protein